MEAQEKESQARDGSQGVDLQVKGRLRLGSGGAAWAAERRALRAKMRLIVKA